MQASKEFMRSHNIYPRISFQDRLVHEVELVSDKNDSYRDTQGVAHEGVKFLVKEDGVLKTFFTTSASLISFLSTCDTGDFVNIEMQSKNIGGSMKTVYRMSKSGEAVLDDDESTQT